MNESPRILIVAGEVFANGGIQRFNRTLLAALGDLRVTARVLSLNDSSAHRQLPLNVTVRPFGRKRLRFALQVLREIVFGSYDVLLVGHVRYLTLMSLAHSLRPMRGPQLLLIGHGLEVWTGILGARRRALRKVHRVLCVSEFTRRKLLEQAPELQQDRLIIFPNALGKDWANRNIGSQQVAPCEPAGRFLLTVTRLEPQERLKGVITTLEALAMLDADVHYAIAGRGSDLDFLRGVARRLGVSNRVTFLGAVTDEQLVGLYQRCAAFVLPSAQEGFGIVFLEAMYFGAPPIAAHEKGAVDVVSHERTGLTVTYGDVVALRFAIQRILADDELRAGLAERGRATVTGDGIFTYGAFLRRLAIVLGADAVTRAPPPMRTVHYPP